MRFAYIDSQGAEVSIPSVDALALRIELGAIGPDTQLYDEQADRWGPAHTHEIFHTLSRGSDEGFVAPPPAVPPPTVPGEEPADEEPAVEEPAEEEPAEGQATDEAPDAEKAPAFDLSGEFEGAEPAEPEAPAADGGDDLGFDLTLTDASEPAAEELEASPSPAADEDLGFDLVADAAPDAPAAPESAEPEEEGAFDFGGMGALELEATEEPELEEASPAPLAPEPTALEGAGSEDELSFGGGGGGGMDLEQPLSEFTPEAPPAWMEQEGPPGGDDDDGALDFSRPAAEEDEAAPVSADEGERPERKERPQPRSRPSPPRRRRGFPVKPLLGLILLGGVGYGGWYGWGIFQASRQRAAVEQAAPVRPAVVIPEIPAELLPQMRDIGEAALSDMIGDLQALQRSLNLPARPRPEWLEGVYLANASQYPDVPRYFQAIETFVDSVRAVDTRTFHDRYLARVRRARVSEETAPLLVERADSGFMATMDGRFEAYAQMEDLINAALDLHQFLLDNEESIEYQPASTGISEDPLLEAVPTDRSVANEMGDLMTRIADALTELGTLNQVTTERLTAVLYDRIRGAGFR